MTGRRAAIGLSLLCALAFSAFGAASASAVGTTAFTCAPVTGKAGTLGFKDEHCTNAALGEAVSYEHLEIDLGVTTSVSVTNKATAEGTANHTPWLLSFEVGGAKAEIECTNLSGTGSIENLTTLNVMETVGTLAVELSTCKVLKIKNCTVKEPIKAQAKFNSQSAGEEMWIDFIEDAGPLAEITFEGASCALKGQVLKLTGTIKGTASGATINVNTGENKLKFGPNAADLMGAATLRMTGGNPISFTTTEH